jgi:S1-C subfamily serine protease
MDPGVPAGTARYASFATSVREGIQRLGGISVAGAAGTQTTGDKGRRTISSGTGIIVDTQGHLITNDHVVRNCSRLQVIDTTNASHEVTVLARDSVNDLAVLKAAHRWPQAATLRDGHDLRPGESVVVTGYPLSGLVGSSMAVTTGSLTALAGPRDDSRLLQVSAPVQPGNSGGPLLDGGGNVIGVVTGTLNGIVLAVATGTIPQNVNFAIKAAVLRNFLDTNGIGYASAAQKRELSPADIGELARRFTVRVACQG